MQLKDIANSAKLKFNSAKLLYMLFALIIFWLVITEVRAGPVTVFKLVDVNPETTTMLFVVAQLKNIWLLGHCISNKLPKYWLACTGTIAKLITSGVNWFIM